MNGERDIFLATQHDATVDEPSSDQIYMTGTLGRILQAQRQENGQIKVVVEGRERGQSVRIEQDADDEMRGGENAQKRPDRRRAVTGAGHRMDPLAVSGSTCPIPGRRPTCRHPLREAR